MKICLCCKQNGIKPTFYFYCRWCCGYLQQRCGLAVMDYIICVETMYNKMVHVEDCSYKGVHEIHNHFTYSLRITDRPVAELLETILLLKSYCFKLEMIVLFFMYIK